MKHIMLILAAMLLSVMVGLRQLFRSREAVANSYSTHPHPDGKLNRVSEAAISTRHLLVTKGTAANSIAVQGATGTEPLGSCPDTPVVGGIAAVCALGAVRGTVTMIASKAIAENTRVYTAANGKITDSGATSGSYLVGKTVEAAAADGSEVEVIPFQPVIVP